MTRLMTNILFFALLALAVWFVVAVLYPAYWGLIGWADQGSLKLLASGFIWLLAPFAIILPTMLIVSLISPHVAYGLSVLLPLLGAVFAGLYTLLFFLPALILMALSVVFLFI